MRKMVCLTSSMLMAGVAGLAAYTLMNKKTAKKANKLINTMLDETDNMIKSKMD